MDWVGWGFWDFICLKWIVRLGRGSRGARNFLLRRKLSEGLSRSRPRGSGTPSRLPDPPRFCNLFITIWLLAFPRGSLIRRGFATCSSRSRDSTWLARHGSHAIASMYTRLVSNSAPTWSSRCCFTACHFKFSKSLGRNAIKHELN